MEKRALGKSGLQVAPLTFGGNVFGWTINESTSFALLDAFVDAGFNCVDTADVYSRWKPGNQGGESEIIIGKWLKKTGKRDKIVLATKVGMEMGPEKKGLAKKYILKAVEDSLTRLQTDHIDLYQSHRDDPDTPLQETLEAYSQLIKQGKVRVIGASNYSGSRLREALQVSEQNHWPSYQSLQPLYNLYDRAEFEKELQTICVEKEIGVIGYYSLASGFLTGKYRSDADVGKSARGAGIQQKYMNERGFRILKGLDQVAEQHRCKPGQVALAWLLTRPAVVAPIASATNLDQLHELIQSVNLKLSQKDIELLDQASLP